MGFDVGDTYAFQCTSCSRVEIATVQATLSTPPPDPEDRLSTGWELVLVTCGLCGEPSLAGDNNFFSSIGPPAQLWPPTRPTLNELIPEAIRRELDEARKCYDNATYTATALMVRRAIEGFCQAHNAKGRDLNEDLKKLAQDGVIDTRLAEWAHGLRVLGRVS